MITTALVLLLVLLALSIPVGAALGTLGLILDPLYSMLPLTQALGEVSWSTSTEFLMVAIPLFILLGEILLRSGIAEKMYSAMSLWLSWLPGGLMHANIGASALFSATSGSSVATAATVGTVAIPEIKKQGYNESLFLGSIAAGGTLGILIPPSINLIIYGVLTNTSVPRLYLADPARYLAVAVLYVGHRLGLHSPSGLGWKAHQRPLGGTLQKLDSPLAAACDLSAGGRFHLCRNRHTDRSGCPGRCGRFAARPLSRTVEFQNAACRAGRHDAVHCHDHVDRSWGGIP